MSRHAAWLFSALLAVFSLHCGGASQQTSGHDNSDLPDISPVDLNAKLVAGDIVHVFDNNVPELYAIGHVPHAQYMSVKGFDANRLPKDKAAMLVFYCANEH